MEIPSLDGLTIAVHELAPRSGRPPLLISHATGFHAMCYTPIARALSDRYDVFGLDYRGHGDSPVDPSSGVDWRRFGDDALATARTVAPDGGLVAFGHSMGGAALLMAAHREPELFERLVLFEPIAHPATRPTITPDEMRALPIVQGALRRRRTFETIDAARENYRSKPPLSLMTPEVLRNYVEHGFESVGNGTEVTLRCTPEFEAEIFVSGSENGVWDLLRDVSTPCVVIAGIVEESQPSSYTELIAEELPHGIFVPRPDQTHFGPFSHPDDVAALIAPA